MYNLYNTVVLLVQSLCSNSTKPLYFRYKAFVLNRLHYLCEIIS